MSHSALERLNPAYVNTIFSEEPIASSTVGRNSLAERAILHKHPARCRVAFFHGAVWHKNRSQFVSTLLLSSSPVYIILAVAVAENVNMGSFPLWRL